MSVPPALPALLRGLLRRRSHQHEGAPVITRAARGVRLDRARAERFRAELRGYGDAVPPTFLYALCTPLQAAAIADAAFPFPVLGLVHLQEQQELIRPPRWERPLALTVEVGSYAPHPSGVQLQVRSSAADDDGPVWTSTTPALRRAGPRGRGPRPGDDVPVEGRLTQDWTVDAAQGWRYGRVAHNLDPIHLHRVTARWFGLQTAIVHGMWTVGRALSALGADGDAPMSWEARFWRPVPLPATVRFVADGPRFAVRTADGTRVHVEGTIRGI